MDLKEAGILGSAETEQRHWYYVSKARALERCVADRPAARILDVGAGSGFFSRTLLRDTDAQSAVCVDPGYTHEWSETEGSKTISFRRHGSAASADLILLMDVLEHVDDDLELLRGYVRQVQPGARFVVSVPAFDWLWSAHDVFLEHRRRYTLRQLLHLVGAAGLQPTSSFYFFGALLPAVAARRLAARLKRFRVPESDLRRHHPLTNAVFTAICLAEATVARYNRAFGLTAFVVAEKP